MPSVSKQQQKFFGLVRALQKGDVSPSSVSKKARDAAKDMKKSDVKKYAATKHKGLPRKVKGETKVKSLIKKMVREILDEQQLDEKCQPGYMTHPTRKTKKMFGKTYRNCVKKENVAVNHDGKAAPFGSGYKKTKKLKEDGHTDVSSVVRKLKLSIEDSQQLLNKLSSMSGEESLPSWWTAKITKSSDYLNTARDFLLTSERKLSENEMTHITTKDTSKQKLLKLARMLPDLGLKNKVDYKLSSNGKILAINTKKIGLNQKKYFKKKLGIDLSEGKLTENKRQIAQTILKQLGGRRFIAMTGAKNIGFTNKGLSMKIGKNAKGITHVVVDYNRGKDLYDMEFVKIRGTKRTGKKVKSVYADDLKTIFKGYTGLRTSL